MDDVDQIEVTAIYGATTLRGLVQMRLQGLTVLIEPAKAREVATFLLEAAGAAEGDEAMMAVLGRMDAPVELRGQLLMALRMERSTIDRRARDRAREAIAFDQEDPDAPA